MDLVGEEKVVFTPLYAITGAATGVDPVREAQEAQRRRAERFGVEYHEPPKDMFPQVKRYANPFLIEEAKQKKREERGIRFGLIDPEEKAKKERRLQKFGMTATPEAEEEEMGKELEVEQQQEEDDGGGMELEVREERKQWPVTVKRRPDTLYFYGTDKMSTEDVFTYFGTFKPLFVEWIDDSSCNVFFSDFNTAVQAFMSVTTEQLEDVIEGIPPSEPEILYLWRRGRQWGKYPMLTRFATIEDRRPLVPKKSAYFEEMMRKRADERKRNLPSLKVTITKEKQQQRTKNKKSKRERRRKDKKREEMELNDAPSSDRSGRKKKPVISAVNLDEVSDEARRLRALRFGGASAPSSIPPLNPDPSPSSVPPLPVPIQAQPVQPSQPSYGEHLL